ncbi:amidohydrolase family protein [Salinisphaera aquimarina]|uniref:Amidohydrolase family protein n=1 Tax=Salinisphaera aquimarina TaxID=2094031 RepID=A0ABV7EK89_9GAMM
MTTPAEQILEPERPIIDPHHHLWDRSRLDLKEGPFADHGFTQMLRERARYLLEEFQADLDSGHNIRASVFIECRSMYRADGPKDFRCVGETEFVNGVAAMAASGTYGDARACAGIVSHVDLRIGAQAKDVLQAHIEAGGGRFRGIRHSAAYDADANVLGPLSARGVPEGLFRDADFREGFAALQPLGLTFDAWLLEPQLPDVIDLAQAFPDTAIVLDHVGGPVGIGAYAGQRETRFAGWRDQVRALAACENVVVKLGGLAMPFPGFQWSYGNRPASSQDLAKAWAPYIETCIEAFGVERCMFESNFPVDHFTCDYDTLWNAFKHLVADYSEHEKNALFSGTAARIYALDNVV